MKRLIDLDEIGPVRLVRAREAILERHPGTAAAPSGLPSDRLAELRRRVAAVKADPVALDALALELSPREVRGLITGLGQWEDLRAATEHLLRLRARPALLTPLWRAWQRYPGVAEIRALLLDLAERFGWSEAVGTSYAGPAREWVASDAPGVAIQRWLDALGLSYSDTDTLTQSPFQSDTPLLRLVRDAVMTHGTEAQLRVEGPERLHKWTAELSPDNRVLFGRNYLVRIRTDRWYRPIVEWIERSYGVPRRPKVPSFWEGVPERVQKAFQQLFIRRWIREIFHNDIDRRDFWERWADHMEFVQRGEVKGTEYGVLDFGTFGVVEFFEYGHAAFFYPEEMLKRIRSRDVWEVGQLKEKYYAPFEYEASNRLIHNPSPRGWYARADEKVTAWIHGTRRKAR